MVEEICRRKIKSEKKNVDRNLFKKFMKVINSGQGGANVLSPSDIMNDVEKYSQLVSMMSSPMFSKNKVIQEYYDAMREHLGLPEFSMPEIKSEGHSDAIKNAGPIEEKEVDEQIMNKIRKMKKKVLNLNLLKRKQNHLHQKIAKVYLMRM